MTGSRIYEKLRVYLLSLGPRHPVLRAAIRVQARLCGFRVRAEAGRITLSRSKQMAILADRDYASLPAVLHTWDHLFATTVSQERGEVSVLDFSEPALHTYRKSGVTFHFPGLVEEDSAEAYTRVYRPQPGDLVWDAGAHAGATTYFFSQMVGERGAVYAFEPDEHNFAFLLRNIEMHGLRNVVPVKIALAGATGTQPFSMDGTLGSGLLGRNQCPDPASVRTVETISFADACHRFGVPAYVKMDIEGAEVEVIAGALDVLRQYPIHLAIETEHRIDGQFTSVPITRMLREIGYRLSLDSPTGEQFTWATPPDSAGPH